MHADGAVIKPAVIFLNKQSRIKKQSRNLSPELLHHNINFHPIQFISLRENETKWFFFVLTV